MYAVLSLTEMLEVARRHVDEDLPRRKKTQKDAKTRVWVPWHLTAADSNNLMTDLNPASEMSAL
jgi:hypothetical protein